MITIIGLSGPHEKAIDEIRRALGLRDASTVMRLVIEEYWAHHRLGDFPTGELSLAPERDRLYRQITRAPGIARSRLLRKWRRPALDRLLCELAGRVVATHTTSASGFGRPLTTYTVVSP